MKRGGLAPMTVKKQINTGFIPLFSCLLLFLTGFSFAQENRHVSYNARFQNGNRLYQEARWQDAAAEFRSAQEIAENPHDTSEALYWVIMAELAAADYGSALRDMNTLERITAGTGRGFDIVYHRARAYYYLGYYEESIVQFKRYCDGIKVTDHESSDRKAAAFFWMGECLYSMGQLEDAEKFYTWVIVQYPFSPKIEISSFRMDLIKQKKIEAELLTLLKWSHEESLKTSEDYQRKIKTYENTLNAYQKRVIELSQDSRLSDLENENADYKKKLAEAEEKIKLQESDLTVQEKQIVENNNREKARLLRNEVQWELDNLESGGDR
ncbi:MAG: hypothetical protein LBH44_01405 [Treponema sp.]|jgi:tetratricopeptide (TPR) repeat protein|nr:hypothetical protein [Treponema sp.]